MVAVVRHLVTLEVRVSDAMVEQNIGYYPWVVGRCLADEVSSAVEREGLGYYPPLDYFSQRAVLDPDLLILNETLAEFIRDHVKRELRRRLARVFSTVSIEQIRLLSGFMPPVRPRSAGADEALAAHYAPNRLRLAVQVSTLQRQRGADDTALVRERFERWLGEAFEGLTITAITPLQ